VGCEKVLELNRLFDRFATATAIGGVAIVALGLACWVTGARVNTTKSIPLGLYWTSSAPAEKGAYVMFCPPNASLFDEAKERGYIAAGLCTGHYGYMMKRIVAAEDDVVSVNPEGVRVNGQLLALSAPLKTDKAGRAMPRYQSNAFTLGASEVLLMSDASGSSFDGRYFGAVNRSQITSVIRPVLTW
jgi:conjugative transfer signal peptidase TraF